MLITAAVVVFAFSTPFLDAAVKKNNRFTVVIDAGHGGVDGGVTGSVTGVKESDLNLKISKLLSEYLASAGYYVVETRPESYGLYGENLENFKRRDMEKRAKIIGNVRPDAVVSIHMNFYTAKTRRGAQVFFDKKNQDGKAFANIMQERLNDVINAHTANRRFSALSAEKYILECTSAPVIIVECGFLSNPLDEALLIKTEYQALMASAIAEGVHIYLSQIKDAA